MQSRTPRSESVRVSAGLELRVLSWDGRRPGFVLVHGLASNALLWQGVADALSGRSGDGGAAGRTGGRTDAGPGGGWAVIAIDLRGHGESCVPPDGYDTATAAADVASIIDILGLDRPVVTGQSWGGNVVVQLAAARPDLVGALVLVDGGWIQLRDSFDSWDEVLQSLSPPEMGDRSWSEMRSMISAAHSDWAAWAIEATLANLRELPDGTVRARLASDHHLTILRSMWDHSVTDLYPRVPVPSLLVAAGQRGGPELDAVDRAAAALAGSEVRWYEGADHDVHAQHPVRLAADLLAFAERISSDVSSDVQR